MPFSFCLCLCQMMLSYWRPSVNGLLFSGNLPLQTVWFEVGQRKASWVPCSLASCSSSNVFLFVLFSPVSLEVLADIFIFFLLGSGMCQCCSLEEVSLLQNWVGKHWRKLHLWDKRQNRLFDFACSCVHKNKNPVKQVRRNKSYMSEMGKVTRW